MRLVEAYEILQQPAALEGDKFVVCLMCGFNPLHLETLLAARLRLLFPKRSCQIRTGLYGDLCGNLDRLGKVNRDAVVVLVEWSDLDPRLGIRSLGGWTPSLFPDVLSNVKARVSQIEEGVYKASKNAPVVVCLPTLPLPPIAFTSGWQASTLELELRNCVTSLGLTVAENKSVRVVNPQRLDGISPMGGRLDVRSELLTGFPYRLSHANVVVEIVAALLQERTPKKGLITDLDGTLWEGILGEAGPEGISWDLDQGSQMHGLYQQMLHALSAAGVLIGVASKNDASLVEEAFTRKDIILPKTSVFPLEAHWGQKSCSVERILKTWNIGPNGVVFVDDDPAELAEVKAKHPEIECIRFPSGDYEGINSLLNLLRDLFGKSDILEEDRIRLDSIRRAHKFRSFEGTGTNPSSPDFLAQLEGEIILNARKDFFDPRAFELINKTNQFNLNGRRHTEASWLEYLRAPDTFLWVVAYRDKYGPLGKIAVLAGRVVARRLLLETWVMSCRAFSRRIEHTCLKELFARFGAEEIEVDYVPTTRNKLAHDFLESMIGTSPALARCLKRDTFLEKEPQAFHQVQELKTNGRY